jgi:hypothetical protein
MDAGNMVCTQPGVRCCAVLLCTAQLSCTHHAMAVGGNAILAAATMVPAACSISRTHQHVWTVYHTK